MRLFLVTNSGTSMPLLLLLLPSLLWPALISAAQTEYEVAENVRPGQEVANLAHEFSLDMKSRPYLQITNRRSNIGAQSFAINKTTGVLYVVTPPDRDTLCEFQIECMVEMTVAYGDRRNPNLNLVRVKVTDVNDNSPTFPHTHLTLHVPEETDPFRIKLDLMAASDRDFGENGVQTYKIEGDPEQLAPFRLEIRNDGPKLFLQIKLDRERRDSYAFRLVAIDGGRTRRTGTLSISVRVDDVNDQRPRFTKASYEASVDESVMKGTEILRVQAVDRDIGPNGELVFRLAPPSSLEEQMAARYFAVHTIDGEGRVAVKAHLDVDQKDVRHFQFYVEARDKGASPMSAKVRVTVRVSDVNDFRPSIAINYLNDDQEDRNRGFVPEGLDRSFVAQVTVTDLDSGPGGQVECRVGNDGFYLEELTHITAPSGSSGKRKKQFKLMSRGSFDREKAALLTFPLVCVDNGGGEGALTGSTMVDVRVTDRNDVTPTFIRPTFRFKLRENVPRRKAQPVEVGRVTAVDQDEGDNAKIAYTLVPTSDFSRAFRVDPGSGVIRAVAPFDREAVSQVTLTVQATDHGRPKALSSTAVVRIQITDVNDCPPVFTQSHYHFEIMENSRSLTIGQVKAVDGDEGQYGAVRYRVANAHTESNRYFSIHPVNGVLQVNRQLDREHKSQYVLRVLAIDNPEHSAGPRNTGTATVTVNVLDENDCSPRITEPKNNAVIELDDDATIGQLLFTMAAEDDDLGENATVYFSIVSGARGFFAIHEDTGTFYVANKVQHSAQSTFVVHLRASDRGVPRPLNSSITVRIRTNRRSDAANAPHDPNDLEALPVGADQRSIIIILSTIFVLLLITTAVLAWLIKRRRDSERRRYYRQQAHKLGQNEGGKDASEANFTLLHSLAPAGGATVSKSAKYEMEINPSGQREHRSKHGDHEELGCGGGTACRPKRGSDLDYYQSLAGTYDVRGKDGNDKGMHLYYEIHGGDQPGYPGAVLKKEDNDDLDKTKDFDTWNVQTKLPLSAKNTPAATRRQNQQYSPYVEASFV